MAEALKIEKLYDLKETIAAPLLQKAEFPWEVLPHIGNFIIETGKTLPPGQFTQVGEDIWIARTATVAPTALINGPAIIDEDAEIRHCAFIRGNAIVGKKAVVGNSTELKNVILFNGVQVPHYNYVGDSILGFMTHLGAGATTSNIKSDRTPVQIKIGSDMAAPEAESIKAETGIAITDNNEVNIFMSDSVKTQPDNIKTNSIETQPDNIKADSIETQPDNIKTDTIEMKTASLATGLKKCGAMLGDFVEVGCNSVLNPGTVIGRNTTIYPLSMVRGFVPADSIYKKQGEITQKNNK